MTATSWKPFSTRWKSFAPGRPDRVGLPAILATPPQGWVYGAGSDPILSDRPVTVRIRAMAIKGRIGFCLVSEDYGKLVSPEPEITPEQGDTVVEFELLPQNAPARIVVRNQGDEGVAGEVVIGSVIICERPPAKARRRPFPLVDKAPARR